jgi:hypothetical protein
MGSPSAACMKTTGLYHWVIAASVAALLPVTAQASSGHSGGGFGGHGFSHHFGSFHGFGDHHHFFHDDFFGIIGGFLWVLILWGSGFRIGGIRTTKPAWILPRSHRRRDQL